MADFCRECTIEVFGEEYADRNDFVIHTIPQGCNALDVFWRLCEHCGPGWFDIRGQREKENEHST